MKLAARLVLTLMLLTAAAGPGLTAVRRGDAAPYVLDFRSDGTDLVEKVNAAGAVAPSQRAALARHLTANRAALDRLAMMGLALRAVRFHRTPDRAVLREACASLAARGLHSESQGRIGEATHDWLALFNVGRAAAWGASRRSTVDEVLAGLRIESLGVRPLLRLARAGRLTKEGRARIRAALAERARDGIPTLAFALACERDAARDLDPKGGSAPAGGTYEERSREAARAWSLLAARYAAVISAAGSGTPVPALVADPKGPKAPLERVLADLTAALNSPRAVAAAREIDGYEAAIAELVKTTGSR